MEKARILIVEDEAIIAMELESNLKNLGYQVVSTVDSSEDAIRQTEESKPDLILMDIRIKGEPDGIVTAEIIRNRFGIPIVFSTAYLDQERLDQAKITMPFGYLIKPIQEKDLKITLEMALYIAEVDAERSKVEQSLRESQQKLAFHMENAPIGAIEFDQAGEITSWNAAAERIFGYSKDEIIGRNTFDALIPQKINQNVKEIWQQIVDGRNVENINENLTKLGTIVTCKWFNTRLIDENGRVIGIASMCQDITEQKRTEDALKESEEKYKNAFKTSPDAVNINKIDGTYVDINEGFCNLTGFTKTEVIGRSSSEIKIWANPEDRERLISGLQQNGFVENLESTFRDKDGTHKTGLMSARLIHLQGEPHILSITRDISERKKIADQLLESEKRYRMIFERSSDAVFLIDLKNGKFLEANSATEQLTGRTTAELKDQTLQAITELPSKRKIKLDGPVETSIDFGEVAFIRPGGSERNTLLNIIPLEADKVFGIARDITDIKKTNELIIQTEKMMSLGGLAAGMAHELNNPLGGILQGIQNIRRRLSPDLKSNITAATESSLDLRSLKQYLEKRDIFPMLDGIQESGMKAAEIIKNMLQFSRRSESKIAPNDLVAIMNKALDLADKQFDLNRRIDFGNIKIIKEYDPDIPLVACTETEIEQVFLNLLSNTAWAFANRNNGPPPEIILRIRVDGDMVQVEICDNGPGMDLSTRKRVFEPFFTTKPTGEGTGLGLSVSYMIITTNHNGTIDIDSAPGEGTRIVIRLPIKRLRTE